MSASDNEHGRAGVRTVTQVWEAITSRRNVRSFDGRPTWSATARPDPARRPRRPLGAAPPQHRRRHRDRPARRRRFLGGLGEAIGNWWRPWWSSGGTAKARPRRKTPVVRTTIIVRTMMTHAVP